jgi:hypothetical protein
MPSSRVNASSYVHSFAKRSAIALRFSVAVQLVAAADRDSQGYHFGGQTVSNWFDAKCVTRRIGQTEKASK